MHKGNIDDRYSSSIKVRIPALSGCNQHLNCISLLAVTKQQAGRQSGSSRHDNIWINRYVYMDTEHGYTRPISVGRSTTNDRFAHRLPILLVGLRACPLSALCSIVSGLFFFYYYDLKSVWHRHRGGTTSNIDIPTIQIFVAQIVAPVSLNIRKRIWESMEQELPTVICMIFVGYGSP